MSPDIDPCGSTHRADGFRTVWAEVSALIRSTPVPDLPKVLGQLEAAKAQAWARLHTPTILVEAVSHQADRLLTMPQVADRLDHGPPAV